jgi:transcriptional regulator GlxA family with amidase domain
MSLAVNARRVTGICTGAFYLAEAPLLDGHRATKHWRWAPLLQSRFPSITVDVDRNFGHDRALWTSAGVTAGIRYGPRSGRGGLRGRSGQSDSARTARLLPPPGGQSQFSVILDLEPASSRVRDALAFAHEHRHENLSVKRLARSWVREQQEVKAEGTPERIAKLYQLPVR